MLNPKVTYVLMACGLLTIVGQGALQLRGAAVLRQQAYVNCITTTHNVALANRRNEAIRDLFRHAISAREASAKVETDPQKAIDLTAAAAYKLDLAKIKDAVAPVCHSS